MQREHSHAAPSRANLPMLSRRSAHLLRKVSRRSWRARKISFLKRSEFCGHMQRHRSVFRERLGLRQLTVALHDFLDETWKNSCPRARVSEARTDSLLWSATDLIIGCDHVRHAVAVVGDRAEAAAGTHHVLLHVVQNLHPPSSLAATAALVSPASPPTSLPPPRGRAESRAKRRAAIRRTKRALWRAKAKRRPSGDNPRLPLCLGGAILNPKQRESSRGRLPLPSGAAGSGSSRASTGWRARPSRT